MNLMQGKLSYTVAAILFVWGIVGLVTGWLDPTEAMQRILEAGAVFGIRRAL